MALPWNHWTPAPIQIGTGPSVINATLPDIVRNYVEQATNYENRLAETIELASIRHYATNPSLQPIIFDVLLDRLSKGWPWCYKVLDIISYLQSTLKIPIQPPLVAPISVLVNSPPDNPKGTAGHIRKAAEGVLKAWGYDVGVGSADWRKGVPGVWPGRLVGNPPTNAGWGGSYTGRLASGLVDGGSARGWGMGDRSLAYWYGVRGGWEPQDAQLSSIWSVTQASQPFPKVDGSVSTTSFTPGGVTEQSLAQHHADHAKKLEEARRAKFYKWW